MSLYIYIKDEKLREMSFEHLKKRRPTDSGCDILCPSWSLSELSLERFGLEMKLGIHCAAVTADGKPAPYLLLARSSTSLTPFRMSNQLGLADMGYRGELIARVDVIGNETANWIVGYGQRLFQIVQHNWLPWDEIILVDSLDELPVPVDDRGDGGFGSTGK
jgi:dUTPase